MSTITKPDATIQLSTGEWPFTEVRPDHWTEYFLHAGESPEEPFDEKKVLGDEIERITPPDDDPRWTEHNKLVNGWNALAQEFEWLMALSRVDVPEDWVLPDGVQTALGILPDDTPRGRKLHYIRFHVLGTRIDIADVSIKASGIITQEERAVGGDKFPGDAGDEAGDMEAVAPDSTESVQVERADGE